MEPIRIVIVGLNFGSHILRQIVDGPGRPYLQLVGVCDLDTERCTQKGHELGVRAYATLEEVIADPAVEAVGLFTGPSGRARLIRRLMQGGKHVLTTKPFERDANEALDVLREAHRLGIAVFLNSPSALLPPDLAQVEVWRQEFELGRPVAARFDIWASYQETADGRWYDDPEQCPIAPIFRIGIYLINDAVRVFGEAADVQVLSSRLRTGRPTPDNAQLGIRFRSGALANIFASLCIDDGDAHRNAMTLNLEHGTIYRNCGPFQSSYRDGGSELVLVQRGPEGRQVTARVALPDFHPHHVYQWDVFQRAVRGERDLPLVSPETVAAGIRIIEAMVRAENEGGHAEVAPVARPSLQEESRSCAA